MPIDWKGVDWIALAREVDAALRAHAKSKTIVTKQGHVIEYDEIEGRRAKDVIVQADIAFGRLFGLSEVELDYVVNYDIKYRMGQGAEDADD